MTTPNTAQIAVYAVAFLVGFLAYHVQRFIRTTVLPALRRRGRFTVPITGKYLNRLGKMYGIKRKFLEPDESYRNRIEEGSKPHERDRQIDRPCGACAYCGYTGQIERKKRSFPFGDKVKVTVRQYFYCGLTSQELTREQAFYESRCAHWKMCAQLEADRKGVKPHE